MELALRLSDRELRLTRSAKGAKRDSAPTHPIELWSKFRDMLDILRSFDRGAKRAEAPNSSI